MGVFLVDPMSFDVGDIRGHGDVVGGQVPLGVVPEGRAHRAVLAQGYRRAHGHGAGEL
jgi:hypothetical protein